MPCLSGWEIVKLFFFEEVDPIKFIAADLEAADFDVGGFVPSTGYNTFFCSFTADWPEFAAGGGTRMSARLQKQTGTCDLNIVLN